MTTAAATKLTQLLATATDVGRRGNSSSKVVASVKDSGPERAEKLPLADESRALTGYQICSICGLLPNNLFFVFGTAVRVLLQLLWLPIVNALESFVAAALIALG